MKEETSGTVCPLVLQFGSVMIFLLFSASHSSTTGRCSLLLPALPSLDCSGCSIYTF